MSETAWFTLLLRALGLFIIIEMFPGTLGYLATIPQYLEGGFDPVYAIYPIATLVGYLLSITAGIYLLTGGRRIVKYCTRDLVGRCAVCGYPLTKVTGAVCPECGVPFSGERAAVESDTNKGAEL